MQCRLCSRKMFIGMCKLCVLIAVWWPNSKVGTIRCMGYAHDMQTALRRQSVNHDVHGLHSQTSTNANALRIIYGRFACRGTGSGSLKQ